ncbi:NrfD/PsrC family molybdoenzyme membrane anchor subunit [Saccharothrix longispora]|uniref:DMSO reductase anchor subunit n=1 Tax=Saccharothrix longispora TaxID=33920 RepID=A0ABU1PW46_9PSEU|nr:NrfD/PsrC family molybdoenzyme membrane anchor subunit [Saccharothrix longispora]MDR6594865.1 DMSO reductase anchor subunit [Saccharothrix longispora]
MGRRRDDEVVPEAEFRSYHGRQVLQTPAWEWPVPAYLFAGGVSAGSTLLALGADLTGRPALRRAGRLGALVSLGAGTVFLVADLGRPERFLHMLRVAKPTSPMSVGTWALVAYGPGVAAAAAAEVLPGRWWWSRLLKRSARPAAASSAVFAPAIASYTAVLLSQTAVPAWHEAHPHLPFVFTGSAAAASGGLGMVFAPVGEAGPARAFAVLGGLGELAASRVMERRLGLVREAYTTGGAHRLRRWSEVLTAGGVLGAALGARRGRVVAVLSGLALLAGSALQRFGVFEAGVASTKDPKYVVVPQRERAERRERAGRGSPDDAGVVREAARQAE